jgi:hypothetical protein
MRITPPEKKMVGTRLEQVAASSKKMQNGKRSAAKCAAISTDIERIVAAWPNLPEPIRNAMLALVDATK